MVSAFFLEAIRQTINKTSRVDELRIFVAGMSDGEHMSQRLNCEQAGLFAGIAVVTAQFTPELIASCRPSRPIVVLYINGTEDPLEPYDGGAITPQWGSHGTATSTEDTIAFWRRHNRCGKMQTITFLPDLDVADETRVEQQT